MPILYGRTGHSDAYQRYAFCKEFGWDYYTFESQPLWFIDELTTVMNQIAEKAKKESERTPPKLKR